MTYKSSLSKLGLGGGKAVIMADPSSEKTEPLLKAFAGVVNALGGAYICAEDSGTNAEDMQVISGVTPYVVGVVGPGRSGDPSPYTAYGVLNGIKAVAKTLWDKTSLEGVRIAIQGLGNVGSKLAEHLFWAGAELIVSDVNSKRVEELVKRYGAKAVDPDKILEVECDILSPCAMGGILNASSIAKLHCQAVAGGANNQLEKTEDGLLLTERGILYAPDYVINAGGILSVVDELSPSGFSASAARKKVAHIYDILMEVFHRGLKERKPTNIVADEIAENNIRVGISRRNGPLFIAGKKLKDDCSVAEVRI
jgi:leucine dehydrogenase